MTYNMSGIVLFASNGDRNRAHRAVQKMLDDWNTQHAVDQQFTQIRFTDTTGQQLDDDGNGTGPALPAIDFEYSCPTYDPIGLAYSSIYFDINSNAYVEILGLSLWFSG